MKILQLLILTVISGTCVSHAIGQDDNSWASRAETTFTPNIHHSSIKDISLFAANPEIVTPIGIAVAPDGRVFVQENHTHKRNSDYEGPKTDRILVFEDKDNDGVADDRSVFYEGHTFSTDLLFGPDGHLYVSTRWFIGRFPNAANKTKAEGEPEKLIICETDGDYPHNGVGGLTIDPANPEWIAFGFGENLGADYTFVGSDGVKLSGGAEGGSTYRCRTDGSQLTRQSTGHWNAFGMAYDLDGNLFSTDNDPNAIPPNRLLHIVSGADFGYEYRYGRSGNHPLVCWYGENPGTLGMIGALGEAACGLVPHGPGKLLSASWTDNRVDLHSLTAQGESFTATREPRQSANLIFMCGKIQAAQQYARQSGPLGHFFQRIKRRKCHNVAVVATARKLATIAWRMLSTGEPYRYSQPRTTGEKLAKLRVQATGQKRKTGPPKGKQNKAKLPDSPGGSRTIRSLNETYQNEGLPPCEPLQKGELDHLKETETLQFHTQITTQQTLPRPEKKKGKQPQQQQESTATTINRETT